MATKEAYKNHRVGSRKSVVHTVFDAKGKEAALKKALSLDLAMPTIRSWFWEWNGGVRTADANKVKKGAKKSAKKSKVAKTSKPRAKVAKTPKPRAKVSKPRAKVAKKRATISEPATESAGY